MKHRRLLRCAIVVCLVVAVLSGAASALTLKTTNEEKWIDRIADLPDYAKDFYTWLEEQAALGKDGALADPSKATLFEGEYVYLIQKQETASLNAADYETQTELQAAIAQVFNQKLNVYVQNVSATYQCFLRDHPEVFWLNGEFSSSGGGSMSYSSSGGIVNVTATISVRGVLKNAEKDIRLSKYQDSADLTSAISERDSTVASILSGASGNRYEKICYLNDWLVKNNAYNSSEDLNSIDGDCRSCISALTGRAGIDGPVCEGYAEAFKVLCDQLDIPCVLVTGYGYNSNGSREEHMWNKVRLEDGKWYGVDVTWNDPVVNGKELQKVSGHENTTYLLVGSETYCSPFKFGVSHVPVNNISKDGVKYLNDPVLEEQAYIAPSCSHSYSDVVIPATCTTAGSIIRTCTSCGTTQTETIPALGHEWGAWKKVDADFHSRSCQRLGCLEKENQPHIWQLSGREVYICKEKGCKASRPAIMEIRHGNQVSIFFVKEPEGLKQIQAAVYDEGQFVQVVPLERFGSEWKATLDKWSEGMTVRVFYLNNNYAPVRKAKDL